MTFYGSKIPPVFSKRIDRFLAIASRHHIRPMFVLFDSCWDPLPRLGPQHPPVPGVHNSGWVQSPGAAALADPKQYPRLKAYVQGVVGAFAEDDRILAWDVWNEPGADNAGSYPAAELKDKAARVTALLPQAFSWARQADPAQPLTGDVWDVDTSTGAGAWTNSSRSNCASPTSSHSIATTGPRISSARRLWLKKYNRPVICTEFMARSIGSTFDAVLPIAKAERVGAINWSFVAGKTQTYLPWESWQHPYIVDQPPVWFHDVLRADWTPYRKAEVDLIRDLAGQAVREFLPQGELP